MDFESVRRKEKTLDDIAIGLTTTDLHAMTDEMVDKMLELIKRGSDTFVTFEPDDPDAYDSFTDKEDEVHMPWTLGHVIVHTTASAEEAAAQSATLARGLKIRGRSRYETPWRNMKTMEQLRQRLMESRRMRHAFLEVWPDNPHLDNIFTPKYPGALPRNAITYFLGGLLHDYSHLGQIENIMRQANAALEGADNQSHK